MDEKFEVVADMANTMLYQQDAQSIDMKHARLRRAPSGRVCIDTADSTRILDC